MVIVRQLRNRYFFALDIVLLITAVVLSDVPRLDTFAFNQVGSVFLFFTGVVIVVMPLLFYVFGIYSCCWMYASVEELLLLSGATTLGTAVSRAYRHYYAYEGESDTMRRGSRGDRGRRSAGANALAVSADSATLEPSKGSSKS